MRLILLGPPGAGKGTQAELLCDKFNLVHISTGDILRDEVVDGSQLGQQVAKFLQSGELVPDDVVVAVVMKRLAKPDTQKGFILDGFPRTLPQAEALNAGLEKLNLPIELVIYFKTKPEVSLMRLGGRRVCNKCNVNFHLVNRPPKKDNICDFCGGTLNIRQDDQEATVKKRLNIYQNQTHGLIEYYKKTGKLKEVSGDLPAEQVLVQLTEIFSRENLIASR
ncbi:MAG: adenylate kinase [Candidatus Omnitrophica bacterium]|nr:adenylate kinase [Candidatus Omnitrophota bacterium]